MAPTHMFAAIVAAVLAPGSPTLPEVAARIETAPPTTSRGDRADDPAIWRNPEIPEKSLVISTDKKAGLAIHDLAGRLLAFQPIGDVNNVDLRDDVLIAGTRSTLVAASDRSDKDDPLLHLFRLDPAAPALMHIGTIALDDAQAYGLCLHRRGDGVDAYMVYREGIVEQVRLDLSKTPVTGTSLDRYDLGSRSEGCVVDDRTGQLYIAEDKVALWRFDRSDDRPLRPVKIADVDGVHLHKDAEGLALLARGDDGGLLIAANQGDDSFSVFRLPSATFAGKFRIGGGSIDGTEETDGIALDGGDFGPDWPGGLFVAHDGKNRDADGRRAPQNFKFVPLGAILELFENGGR